MQPNKQADYVPPVTNSARLEFVDRNDLDDQRLDEDSEVKLIVEGLAELAETTRPNESFLYLLLARIAIQVGHKDPTRHSFPNNLFESESPDRPAVIKLLTESLEVGFARVRRLSLSLPLNGNDLLITHYSEILQPRDSNNNNNDMPIFSMTGKSFSLIWTVALANDSFN